jgi:hypothetical protein
VDSFDDTMLASLLPQAGTRVVVFLPLLVLLHQKKRGVDRSLFDKDEDDSDSGDKKDNKERDYVPVTKQAVNDLMERKYDGDLVAIIASHKKAFILESAPLRKIK